MRAMTTILTRADTSLRDAVIHQLDWDPPSTRHRLACRRNTASSRSAAT